MSTARGRAGGGDGRPAGGGDAARAGRRPTPSGAAGHAGDAGHERPVPRRAAGRERRVV